MELLETEAQRLGYHYVYLWTKTAIGFYNNIGYSECQRVSLKRACLKRLEAAEVQSLENILLKRQSSRTTKSSNDDGSTKNKIMPKKETILLPPDDNDDDDMPDVWLRKRLVEHVGSIHVPLEERLAELNEVIAKQQPPNNNDTAWYYRLSSLPWQAQIGPSCGLAALRMVREYFLSDDDREEQQHLPSLLGEAQERGYTGDGEVFNANHLKDLAVDVCGMHCDMCSTWELTPRQADEILATGGVWILPYDSNARTRLPTQLAGQGAHYGIVVGLLLGVLEASNNNNNTQLRPLEDSGMVDTATTVYLLVQHSLSSKLSIATWSDFLESNQQLVSVDEGKYGQKDLDLKGRIIVCEGIRPGALE
jgi:hypothetical protein